MDFALNDTLLELQSRTRELVASQVFPFERDSRQRRHGPEESLRRELTGLSRDAELLTPQLPVRPRALASFGRVRSMGSIDSGNPRLFRGFVNVRSLSAIISRLGRTAPGVSSG